MFSSLCITFMAHHSVYITTALGKHVSDVYINFTCVFNVQYADTYKNTSVDLVSKPKVEEMGRSCSTHGEKRNT
jgi:hypothetical protein